MKNFHTLSVGIVLATALCGPAKALDFPQEQPLLIFSSEVQELRLPAKYATPLHDTKTQNLILVYEVASTYGHPEVMQAMLLQESNGGTHPTLIGSPNARPSKRSYGILQVQVATARSLFKRYAYLSTKYFKDRVVSEVSDREIMQLLLQDNRANAEIAVVLFDLYLQLSNNNVDRTIAAYNVGIGGVKKLRSPANFKYVREVRQKIKAVVNNFNEQYGLGTIQQPQQSVVFIYNK